jgi:IS30 family transposase
VPFPQALAYRAAVGLELVHTDLCGQISPPTPGGKSYFLLIVDDNSRYMWLELLATKDEALNSFRKSGRRLKGIIIDRGGEFNSGVVVTFCNERGIKHNTATPYTPQQNGVVERRNQMVVEMARCMMKSMKVPTQF